MFKNKCFKNKKQSITRTDKDCWKIEYTIKGKNVHLRIKIYVKTEERSSSVGVSSTKPAECNIYLFTKNEKVYKLMTDEYGNVISRIECSFYSLHVFKQHIYKEIILGKIFPKS